ncbi:MAG: acetolactate synthase small subunit [Candidatus Accumulibacter sp.]|jgi:acetolactate synthase-1/3 small subunit|nr:acetolactate synthase small subunit [Accumulibacter sp.]
MNSITRKYRESGAAHTVLELDVNNHAGVMSHVVGLFSRRVYNVEGILCMPVGDGRSSRIWLTVAEDARIEQMIRQLEKLEDILSVRRHGANHEVFERVGEYFRQQETGDRRQMTEAYRLG